MSDLDIKDVMSSKVMKSVLILEGLLTATLIKQPMWLRVTTVGLSIASVSVKPDTQLDKVVGALNVGLGGVRMANAHKNKQFKKELIIGSINGLVTTGVVVAIVAKHLHQNKVITS